MKGSKDDLVTALTKMGKIMGTQADSLLKVLKQLWNI